MLLLLALMVTGSVTGLARADDAAAKLDEQLQELKGDVLRLSEKLSRIERELLYPDDIRLVFFVSLSAHPGIVLESARVDIDGERVSSHLYSEAENIALQKGGVQRIYTGAVRPGKRKIELLVNAHESDGGRLRWEGRYEFSKQHDAVFIEAQLLIDDTGVPVIRFHDE